MAVDACIRVEACASAAPWPSTPEAQGHPPGVGCRARRAALPSLERSRLPAEPTEPILIAYDGSDHAKCAIELRG